MAKKEMENKEKNICKCPNCGASLSLVVGEQEPMDTDIDKMDEEDQRDVMEKDFKKRTSGKLEEYD